MDAFVTSAASKGKQPAHPQQQQQDSPVAYELPWSVQSISPFHAGALTHWAMQGRKGTQTRPVIPPIRVQTTDRRPTLSAPADASRTLAQPTQPPRHATQHRPRTLDDIVGNVETIERLKVIARDGNCPHIIISVRPLVVPPPLVPSKLNWNHNHARAQGSPGIGKTTSILALARALLGDNYKEGVLELNASDERCVQRTPPISNPQVLTRCFPDSKRHRRRARPDKVVCAEKSHPPARAAQTRHPRRSRLDDDGSAASPPPHDGTLLQHDQVRPRVQPEQQDYRTDPVEVRHPPVRPPERQRVAPALARNLQNRRRAFSIFSLIVWPFCFPPHESAC